MILIALGSNCGDRAENLAHARAALTAHDIDIHRESSIVETPALLPPNAPRDWDMPFLNQVIVIRTTLDPYQLLALLKIIEEDLGRKDRGHWAPREIDLDLIAYNDEIIITDALTVPHPRMDERRFVLDPLREIAPDWRHPVLEKTAAELLKELRA